jgi:undecaprenyl-diphosphatase
MYPFLLLGIFIWDIKTARVTYMHFSQLIILALIQGAAELLPVSSSAHVIVAQHLMGLDPGAPEMTLLLVMLHTGTMGAVIVYFWPRWRRLLAYGSAPFFKAVLIATACTGVVGFGLKLLIEKILLERIMGYPHGEVEHLFRNLPLMGVALGAAGILILIAARRQSSEESRFLISSRSATVIGLVQGFCLPFRGFSRSGATISTALLSGLSRDLAEDFSFALALLLTPPAVGLELLRFWRAQAEHATGALAGSATAGWLFLGVAGMVLSFGAGVFALIGLSKVLDQGRWQWFGYYCLVASGFVLLGPAFGLL